MKKKTLSGTGLVVGLSATGLGLLAFGLYLRSLAPTVLYYDLPDLRDSAVLQAKAYVLGIPDYTGYPGYILLGKLFTYLPVGDVAYRVNLASAVYAALAVLLVYLIGVVLTGKMAVAAAGAAAFCVSQTFWSQAVVAEVYTLNAFLIALVIFVLLLWRERRRNVYLILAAFLMGLSLTDHLTSGLLLPAALVFVLLVDRRKIRDAGLLLKGAGAFLAGLTPYIFIPVRASMDYLPDGFAWGQPLIQEHPPNTLEGFYILVSGGLWKDRMFVFGPDEIPGRLNLYLEYLYGQQGQFHPALVLVGVVGMGYLIFKDRAAATMLGSLFFGWLIHALEYNIEDIYLYFIPTFLIFGILITAGFASLMEAAEFTMQRLHNLPRAVALLALSALIVVSPLTGVTDTFEEVDRSRDYTGRRIMETVAREAKPHASILHHRSPLNYLLLVEKRRRDLTLINYLESRNPPLMKKVRRALEKGPVYVLFPGSEDTPYYAGVETSKLLYRNSGFRLKEIDGPTRFYEVVRSAPSS